MASKYAVRTIAKVGEETIAGGYDWKMNLTATDAPEVAIDVADVALDSEGNATVTATVTDARGRDP